MRLLAGVLAAAPLTSVLTGDPSLSVRPMERVAAPLRAMGAEVETTEGHAPLLIRGTKALQGARFAPEVPSAQVKSAILLSGLLAAGPTSLSEPLLSAETEDERSGIVPNVVFPTAIETVDGRDWVFYGMADSKIGVALLERVAG